MDVAQAKKTKSIHRMYAGKKGRKRGLIAPIFFRVYISRCFHQEY
jgi:hypothetical protein